MGMNCNKKSGAASIRMQPPQNTQSVFFHVLSFYTMGYHLSMADEITSKVDWITLILKVSAGLAVKIALTCRTTFC
jgi:hypothetical protein